MRSEIADVKIEDSEGEQEEHPAVEEEEEGEGDEKKPEKILLCG